MQKRWNLFLLSLISLSPCGACAARRENELGPPPEFLFEPRMEAIASNCSDRKPGMKPAIGNRSFALKPGNEAPYAVTKKEEVTLTQKEVAALTVMSDPSSEVNVKGISGADWKLSFCATGEGDSESEAREALKRVLLERVGSTVLLRIPSQIGAPMCKGSLLVEAPKSAPLVIHASYGAVSVLDMSGPLRVAATHARAKILDVGGQVSVMAAVVDFAGSRGEADLSADAEINLKVTATRFNGRLMGRAQGPVRMLIPPGFTSSFEAVVSSPRDFVCRADFCAKVKHKRQNNLHIFRYAGEGSASQGPVLKLRSETAAVVIYGTDRLAKR